MEALEEDANTRLLSIRSYVVVYKRCIVVVRPAPPWMTRPTGSPTDFSAFAK